MIASAGYDKFLIKCATNKISIHYTHFQAKTHGVAFQLLGENALSYLDQRECQLGGYVTHMTMFHPRSGDRPHFPVLLYMATPANRHWMGPAPLEQVAEQVGS